jgi:putative ABC transport system permease protein
MFKNYLKISLRSLLKQKGYSFLNIAGLAVGLAVCLAILIYVRYETSYDNFHADKDRIVRIERRFLNPDGSERGGFSSLAPGFIPHLEKSVPAIEKIARLLHLDAYGDTFVTVGETSYKAKRCFMADAALFEILTIPLLEGDPKTAIAEPNTVVLSASTARRYFGGQPALGKMLKLEHGMFGSALVRVTGVMKDTPANSHVHFDLLASLTTVNASPAGKNYFYGNQNFSDNVTYAYAKLAKGATPASLAAMMPAFLDGILPARTDDQGRVTKPSSLNRLFVRPVTDIHLQSHTLKELEPNSDQKYVTFFTVIALFILIVACINFINMSTARASQRAREVGLRKVVGGHRKMLAVQFLFESVTVVIVSLLLALVLVVLTLPAFGSLAGRPLNFSAVTEPGSLLAVALVFLFASIASGLYPAAYLSAFKPAAILRGELTRGTKGTLLRKLLVVFQFAISIVLIVSVGVVGRQMNYLRNADLGFDRENIVLLPASSDIIQRWDEVRQALTANPAVLAATLSKRAPSGSLLDAPGFAAEVNGQRVRATFSMPHNRVSHEFFKTYAIKLVAGRDFSTDFPTDAAEAFILNETAVRRLGWKSPEEAIDKPFWVFAPNKTGRIIGVVADFNYESLHRQIVPVVSYIAPNQANTLSIRVAAGRPQKALDHIRSVWDRFRPGKPFEFDFLDTRLRALYENEERMMKIFGAFSFLAVLIACLGLFGLASYSVAQRTREIGIRKILGASSAGIVALFSREFAKWVLAANLVAWPVAYLLMEKWLKNFAYRISIGGTVFVAAAALTLAIALVTVFSQSVRAALANPADSLRHE